MAERNKRRIPANEKETANTGNLAGVGENDKRPQMSGGAGSAGSSPVVLDPNTSASQPQNTPMTSGPAVQLFADELTKMLYTENVLLKMLRVQAEQAGDADLHDQLERHRQQTEHQVARLKDALHELGKSSEQIACHVADAFVRDTNEAVNRLGSDLRVPIYVAANIRVEHFELGAYDSLIEMAKKIGQISIAANLKNSRDEEEAQLVRLMRFSTTIDPRKLIEKAA
ncbi:MAG TPA: DUF892 family protein [Terriglobales bacterium]|nr:DUF892 family protein [Terriglobales bacterium]